MWLKFWDDKQEVKQRQATNWKHLTYLRIMEPGRNGEQVGDGKVLITVVMPGVHQCPCDYILFVDINGMAMHSQKVIMALS